MLRELEKRLLSVSIIVLSVFALVMLALTGPELVREREQEDILRAGLVAKTAARQIERAIVTRPLSADIVNTALSGRAAGHQWRAEDATGKLIAGTPEASGMPVREVLHAGATRVGSVTVYVPLTLSYRVLVAPILFMALLICAGVLLAREALRYAIRRGPLLRDLASASMVDRVGAQDLTMTVREGLRQPQDERASMLGGRVLELNEIYFRLRRLIESLIQTEPEAEQRNRLERLLKDAHGGARFSNGSPKEIKLATVEVDIRWLFALALAAFASLKTVLAMTIDGVGLALASLIAMPTGVIIAQQLSARAMRGGTPTQYANAGLFLVVGAGIVCWATSSYQTDWLVAVAAGGWATLVTQLAFRGLDFIALVAASAGAVWVVQGGLHVAAVARDEGSPAMPQSWQVGAVLGLEVLGVVAGIAFVAIWGRSGALLATVILGATAWFALVLSQWAANSWTGFHFVRDNDLSVSDWKRDTSVWFALTAGLAWGALHATTLAKISDVTGAERVPVWLAELAALGLGAYSASHVKTHARWVWVALATCASCALLFLLPAFWPQWRGTPTWAVITIGASAALGFAAWTLRISAWSQPADPHTRLARLSMADMLGVLAASMLVLLGEWLGARMVGLSAWVLVLLAMVIAAVQSTAKATSTSAALEGGNAT